MVVFTSHLDQGIDRVREVWHASRLPGADAATMILPAPVRGHRELLETPVADSFAPAAKQEGPQTTLHSGICGPSQP